MRFDGSFADQRFQRHQRTCERFSSPPFQDPRIAAMNSSQTLCLNWEASLERVVRKVLFRQKNVGCCGFAGDRGFLFPELTEEATRQQSTEIQGRVFDGFFQQPCEVGISGHWPCLSFLYLSAGTGVAFLTSPAQRRELAAER